MTAAIEIKGLTHTYQKNFWEKKRLALDDLSLTVGEGEIFGFLGANGAGKTTTIKILAGLQYQTRGEASIFGIPARDMECRRLMGFMPENPYFYEYLTARESLDFYGALCDLPRAERAAHGGELLEFVGLSEAANIRLREFSKGMRQRLGIAQAIVHKPRLVILDEPMSGLDPAGRRQVREAILNLRAGGATIFFSSHILTDIEMICDRAALVDKGRLLAIGRLPELLDAKEREYEVGAADLSEADRRDLAALARRAIAGENETLFIFADGEAAAKAVRMTVERGRLVSFRPIRESLEDYFMRTTGRTETEAEHAHIGR